MPRPPKPIQCVEKRRLSQLVLDAETRIFEIEMTEVEPVAAIGSRGMAAPNPSRKRPEQTFENAWNAFYAHVRTHGCGGATGRAYGSLPRTTNAENRCSATAYLCFAPSSVSAAISRA